MKCIFFTFSFIFFSVKKVFFSKIIFQYKNFFPIFFFNLVLQQMNNHINETPTIQAMIKRHKFYED